MATADALTDTDKIITAAEKFGDKLTQLATQYGPDVADVALAAARVDAASGLLIGGACAVLAVISAVTTRALYRAFRVAERAWQTSDGAEPIGLFFTMLATGAAGGVAAIVAFVHLVNAWRWVGIFEPKVWLAGKLLGWM